MKQNKFSINEKIKYIKIAESQGFKIVTIHFANEFREIYKNKSVNKKSQKEGFLQTYANNLIRNWQKYYNYGMNGLISTRGKNKSPPKSKKQYTINDLSENKRRIYQEIMENNIQQSMSPKGNALANRPIEYFYAILQREYLNVEGKIFENLEDAHQKISSFVKWYQKTRVQNCFSYLRPNSHFEQFDTQKNFHNFGE